MDGPKNLIKALIHHKFKSLHRVKVFEWSNELYRTEIVLRERSQNTYAFRGGGGQRFFTFLCKNIGICTVLRYEGGGGGHKS
jgi:hypothetical protein